MLEKVGHIAAQAATSVSRRQFLGRFGKGALTFAGVLEVILVQPRSVSAGRSRACPPGYKACGFNHRTGEFVCCPRGRTEKK